MTKIKDQYLCLSLDSLELQVVFEKQLQGQIMGCAWVVIYHFAFSDYKTNKNCLQ